MIAIGILAVGFMVCLCLLWRFNRLNRIAKRQMKDQGSLACPSVSIIVIANDQAQSLNDNLPLFLQQTYEGEYEVIVVDIHSNDETKDVLENLECHYPNLIHTTVPASARDISLNRLALSLGFRAAGGEWVVFTKADCTPQNDQWLKQFMASATDDADAILGCTKIDDAEQYAGKRMQFFALWQQMMWMPHAEKHRAYRTDENLIAVRKSSIQDKQFFANSLQLIGSVHSLLVNHNIKKKRCALATHPDTMLVVPQPHKRQWNQERVFFMEERRLIKHPCLYRWNYALQVLVPRLFGWYAIALSALLILKHQWPFAAAAIFCWLLNSTLRMHVYRQTAKRLEINPSIATFWWFEHRILYWNILAWLEWRFTKKKTFRKKFV